MDVPLAYPKDSHGIITNDGNKIDPFESVLSASVEHTSTADHTYSPTLHIAYDNIDYNNIPNFPLGDITYKYILAYNGTMSRSKGLYSQVLDTKEGQLAVDMPLAFKYNPQELQYTQGTEAEAVILDVNFYTAEANILQFKGVPVGGNNGPFTNVYKYSYPFNMSYTPMSEYNKTYFDGWYTSTLVLYRDVTHNLTAIAGEVYAFRGVVGKANASGVFDISSTGVLTIYADGVYTEDPLTPLTYEEFILESNNLMGVNSHDTGVLANTQILVTDELNNAIINELKNISCDPACDDTCSIADWQKLQQKRLGAYIYFTEDDYRKAQVIIESSRSVCNSLDNKC